MNLSRRVFAGLVCLVLISGLAAAADPQNASSPSPSPLRFIPDKADFLIQIHHPRQLIEAATTLDTVKQLENLGVAKEFLNSTQYRRFYQLVAYFEKSLSVSWPELLDRIAGGGIAVGVKFGPDPAPSLLVIQGKDQNLMDKFVQVTKELLEREIARQEGPEKIEKTSYEGIEGYHVGDNLFAAQIGSALVVCNNKDVMKAAMHLHASKEQHSLADMEAVADAKKVLPADPLASFWLNMAPVRETPQGKEFYKTPRDPNLTILFGSIIDTLARTPYVTGGVYKDKDGILATIRMPKGRENMGPEVELHLPPVGQPGSRPLLEPRHVIYSDSFYLNVAALWDKRMEFFGETVAKNFEMLDKQSGQFLSGIQVSKVLKEAGPYVRFVSAIQPKVGYNVKPKTSIPHFAVVVEMRDPEGFSRSLNTVLRGAALLYSTSQTKINLVEEKQGDVTLVGYRFPENGVYKPDVNDIRFNFSPCFARVGNQFMVASTLEFGHELADLLHKEAAGNDKGISNTSNHRFYASSVADVLQQTEDQLVTQLILDQALTPDDAKAQVRDFLGILRKAGDLNIQVDYLPNEFRFDFRVRGLK